MNDDPRLPQDAPAKDEQPTEEILKKAQVQARQTIDDNGVIGPLEGFGPMWRKVYRMVLNDNRLSPEEVMKLWKENFPRFWPNGQRFYAPLTGIKPGEVALVISAAPGGLKFSTGVKIVQVDETSFTFITPKGHVFAGYVTFSSFIIKDKVAIQAQVLMRSPDPIMEVAMLLGGHKAEDIFWGSTLKNLAKFLGADGPVKMDKKVVEHNYQWSHLKNLRYNALLNSLLYTATEPFRKLKGFEF